MCMYASFGRVFYVGFDFEHTSFYSASRPFHAISFENRCRPCEFNVCPRLQLCLVNLCVVQIYPPFPPPTSRVATMVFFTTSRSTLTLFNKYFPSFIVNNGSNTSPSRVKTGTNRNVYKQQARGGYSLFN